MASVNTEEIPACPHLGCGAQKNDRRCYTPTGFIRHMHAVRRRAIAAIAAGTPAAPKPASRPSTGRPSHKQADIMEYAVADGGLYELSGYGFHGEAQRRSAITAMVNKQWMKHVRETHHGDLYEITADGRNALARYRTWMNGGQ